MENIGKMNCIIMMIFVLLYDDIECWNLFLNYVVFLINVIVLNFVIVGYVIEIGSVFE